MVMRCTDESHWIYVECRHSSHIPIQIHSTPISDRIPRHEPPQLRVIVPKPVVVNPRLGIKSSPRVEELIADIADIVPIGTEVVIENGRLTVGDVLVSLDDCPTGIDGRSDVEVGVVRYCNNLWIEIPRIAGGGLGFSFSVDEFGALNHVRQ